MLKLLGPFLFMPSRVPAHAKQKQQHPGPAGHNVYGPAQAQQWVACRYADCAAQVVEQCTRPVSGSDLSAKQQWLTWSAP
jgi:hypothetical protein